MRRSALESTLVSVVVPFRDAGQFLREAVESVRAQTYEHWELVLVDDGSRDESVEIAREYATSEPGRIRYAQHEGGVNRGISASRNLGIRLTSGGVIAFVDGDDVWLPEKLARQVALLTAYPEVGMAYGETQYWYSWTGRSVDQHRDMYPPLGVPNTVVVAPPELLVRCLLGQAAVPCTCSMIVRRDVVERVGGFEEQFTGMFEDQAFYAKVMLQAHILVATERWDRYRRHPASVYSEAKRSGTVQSARLRYLAWLRDYLKTNAMATGAVWDALARATWTTRHPRLARVAGWVR